MGVHGEVRCVLTDNGTEWAYEDFRLMLVDLDFARELTAVDGPKNNGRVERRIALASEGAKTAVVEFPKQFPDITFPARTKSYAAISPEAFTWTNDCLNITAAVHKDEKRCPEEKLYGKRRVKQAWPFMMPGFRHRNRPTKMHDKGERCFYLKFGNDHSSDTHKVITPAGIATYSAYCTFGYRRQAFQGKVPTWGGVLLPLRGCGRLRRLRRERHRVRRQQRHLHAAGVFPPRHRRRQQLHVGGTFLPCLHRERRRRGHLGYLCAGRVFFPRFHRHGHRRRRQLHVGGGIPPMSSSGAAATSAAAATPSRRGGIPAAVPVEEKLTGGAHVSGSGVGPPAVVGASPTPPASDPSVETGAATGQLLATEEKQEQLVASGGRREVLAEVSRMPGGTSPVGPCAFLAASPAPPGPPPTSEEIWAGMVHDGGAGGRW